MYITPDRRIKPRIECDYPAVVEGCGADGVKYNDQARLVNLSASGLYMLTNRYIENGSKLAVTVFLSNSIDDHDAPRLVTNGVVVRSEPRANGKCGVAVLFNHYRFI